MSIEPVRALPLEQLRERTSEKWREYDADVLPMFVAETDFPLAPAITAALHHAVDLGDTGYTASRNPLAEAFAGFAQRRYGWTVDPSNVRSTADVSMGIVEILRRITQPGDRVIVTPPVYPPFYDLIAEAGASVERVPLVQTETGWELDLPGIDAAFAGGARALLLCNPHNPTGTVHPREMLAELAGMAARFGARVVSDEIHAPLTQPGVTFTPFLDAAPDAREIGFAVASPSKAFNLAGLKCAVMVTAGDRTSAIVRGMPDEVEWRTSQFGMLASVAALSPESDPWLDGLLHTLDENRVLLAGLIDEHLPGARYLPPDAGYLAWVDLTALGWGRNPAKRILRDAKVAFHFGPAFGEEGDGHVRINFGCSPEVLRDALARVGALVGS
ncbi:MAG TPA: aminotransferase class I/II-fold pyridoxal phosphate-dependent enzyme [Microbacterium sp.]|uniref:MalY/PatB family protein n=1 Tax=Microbacterium sp. TaxID=51671 RepID=UPI002C83FDBD|nr:aminotransferase class I/II-fold pyridoxal phosphate-dependent enzyme [Microbacterium sp.]HWI30815.1 aminotransferase class I/II-fold pyridoxal phosphate-dependent enzyme [Microbacterium sp.]